jgi:nickel-dependent lactate racemase
MLGEIRGVSPEAKITILIGTGCHRAATPEEIEKKFGAEIAARETVINHDSRVRSSLVSLGRLPSGGELVINRLAAEADLLAADGFIEPHQSAGFSGGRKSVLPGIAGFTTVLASHNAEFTVHPKSRPGILEGNLIHKDMLHAARQAKLAFILNVALSPAKRVIAAFAGDMEKAHRAGCDFVLKHCGVSSIPSPIVITSNGGYPLDQNIYQSTKSIMQGDLVCEEGGVIISVNECRDGHGSSSFHRIFKESPSLDKLLGEIEKRGREETVPDQWVIQLTAMILRKRTVIFVSSVAPEIPGDLHMRHAAGLEEALTMADGIIGRKNAPITVLPDAVSLVLR